MLSASHLRLPGFHHEEDQMQIPEMIDSARDALTVKRVFGEPVQTNGVTVIPAAKIGGGAGGGDGKSEEGSGSGGGFGLSAKPAGVYVVRGNEVSWQPAIDVNRIVLGGQIVAIVFLLVLRSIVKSRSAAARD
jgi:uncharacterized spore protein YtfJ